MRPVLNWHDPGLPERDGVKNTVYALDFSSDGELLVVACANLVLIYDTREGDLLSRLKGHKDTVYSVAFTKDGQRFASGGADKTVIIWKRSGEGVLKYTHTDSIQHVAFNPVTAMLASCTATDFGLWSKENKSVSKHKVVPRVLSAAWSNDGSLLALGHENGKISLRDKKGVQKLAIQRDAPVWCLAWAPPPVKRGSSSGADRITPSDLLAVGCWDQTLSFYQSDGTQHLRDRRLHFYPCSLSYFSDGEYIVVGGSDKRATLCTKDAVRLCTVCEKSEWVWAVRAQPTDTRALSSAVEAKKGAVTSPCVAVGCYSGSISVLSLNFGLVHSLFEDRYAHRENMTDVVVTHLPTDKVVRIKNRDYIKKIALYRNRLAVQLPDRIIIWELQPSGHDGYRTAAARGENQRSVVDMHYRMRKEKIEFMDNCVDMLVLAQHVVLCHEKKIQLCAFTCGSARRKEREWVLDAKLTCVRADGGPPGREGLLVGMEDGRVLKIYVNNPFPVEVVRAPKARPIKCIASSCHRTKLAIIDSENRMVVYELQARHQAGAGGSAVGDQLSGGREGAAEGRLGRRGKRGDRNEGKVAEGQAKDLTKAMADAAASATASTGGGNARVLFSEPDATHVAFNDEVDDMLCYSGKGAMHIKIGDFPSYQQTAEGEVIGFHGSRLFCLVGDRLKLPVRDEDEDIPEPVPNFKGPQPVPEGGLLATTELKVVDVPHAASLQRYMEVKDWDGAYRVACLGVTVDEWRRLAAQAASALATDVARKAYVRLKDLPLVDLLTSIDHRRRHLKEQPGTKLEVQDSVFQAELMAYQGQHQDAAKAFGRAGQVDLAVQMFTDLRMWEDAKMFAANSSTIDAKDLVRSQAEWHYEIGDWSKAAEMYMSCGDAAKAVALLGEKQPAGWAQQMTSIARDLSAASENRATLMSCAKFLTVAGEDNPAQAVYVKLDAVDELMALYIQRHRWPEAVALADDPANRGKFDASMFIPYAEWLAAEQRFDEALAAFRRAGRPDESRRMLEQLTFNAVLERRFNDAAYYYTLMAAECLKRDSLQERGDGAQIAEGKDDEAKRPTHREMEMSSAEHEATMARYRDCLHRADIYAAYQHIENLYQPFTLAQPEASFHVAVFLINTLSTRGSQMIPHGISMLRILSTLASNAKHLGAFKLARLAYDRLNMLVLPEKEREKIELDMITIEAKPVRDDQDLFPACYLSGITNPLINPFMSGDVSVNCGHPFIRSFISFEVLPLVEFVPAPGISDEDAIELIRTPPKEGVRRRIPGGAYGSSDGDMGEDPALEAIKSGDGSDFFSDAVNKALAVFEGHSQEVKVSTRSGKSQQGGYVPVVCDADTLQSLRRDEIFCLRPRVEMALAKHPQKAELLAKYDTSNMSGAVTYSPDGRGVQYCRYFRNMLPDTCPIALSQQAGRFFLEEEFELALLKEGCCPLSRVPVDKLADYGHV